MSKRTHWSAMVPIALAAAIALHDQAGSAADASEADLVSFSTQVLPILEARCTECHSGDEPELGLVLATYKGTMAGSEYGPVIEPGDPDESLLVKMIERGDMPEEGDPVAPEELELLRTWIRQGAGDN